MEMSIVEMMLLSSSFDYLIGNIQYQDVVEVNACFIQEALETDTGQILRFFNEKRLNRFCHFKYSYNIL